MLQYIIALISILLFIFLISRKPEIKTYLLFILIGLPIIDTKILPLEYGFIRTYDVVSIISLLVLFKDFSGFKKINIYWKYLFLTILFWFFTLVSNIHSEFGFLNTYLLYQVFTTFIFTRFLFVYCSKEWNNRLKIISAFKKGFTASLCFTALQVLVGLKLTYYTSFNPNVYNEVSGLIRYPGLFSESQYNGQFLAMGSFIFLVLENNIFKSKKYLSYFAFCTTIILLFLAGSRSAIGGFIGGLVVLFFFASNQTKTLGILSAVVVLSIYFIAAPDEGVFSRAATIENDLDFRQEIWEETYEIIKEHPLLGIGFGNFEPYLTKYHQDMYLETSDNLILYFKQPENGYLKILVEQGYLAFGVFLLLILMPLVRALNGIWLRTIERNAMYFCASLVAWMIAFNTVYSFLDYRLLIMVGFWISMLILYIRNSSGLKRKETSQETVQNHYAIDNELPLGRANEVLSRKEV